MGRCNLVKTLMAIKKFKILGGNEGGVTLIETLVALALLGIIGVGLLGGLSTAFKSVMVSHDRVVAEGLANSQLESVKTQNYIAVADYNPNDPAKRYQKINLGDLETQGYEITITPPVLVTVPGADAGIELQRVTIVISHDGEELLTISDYKVGGLT